jgi:hypothetical protein
METTIGGDAYKYRLAQAQKLLDLYEEANGKPASTVEELDRWVGSLLPHAGWKIIPDRF